jgi:UDP-GlcNAc3NAcA epimerase
VSLKICTVIGARPQFIKAASVSRAIEQHNAASESFIDEIIIHTGQHFDSNMSSIFFDELVIKEPHYNLGINNAGHGKMTGRMLEKIEEILLDEVPDWVVVYGDTNSTLAGALAAKKLGIPVAHIEAGLRCGDMTMPEEINRVMTDRISNLLFCPTKASVDNLSSEGYGEFEVEIIQCGDVMLDASLHYSQFAKSPGVSLEDKFILATLHRAENTDHPDKLIEVIDALNEISNTCQVVVPMHPRTLQIVEKMELEINFTRIEPVGYLEMLFLLSKCSVVLTDSGGLQKEAFFFSVPCGIFRDKTEWIELVENDLSFLLGTKKKNILEKTFQLLENRWQRKMSHPLFGDGSASEIIINKLISI